jgi:hypothetical protein
MNLLIEFPDQSQSFAYGTEFGRLLEKIERGDEVIKNNGFPVRVENCSVLALACSLHGYIPTFSKPYMGGWVDFLGIKKTTSEN